MATPSNKSPGMAKFLEDLAGRTSSIEANLCVRAPWGCGGEARTFRDPASLKEYSISGLCQNCQDKVLAKEESRDL